MIPEAQLSGIKNTLSDKKGGTKMPPFLFRQK